MGALPPPNFDQTGGIVWRSGVIACSRKEEANTAAIRLLFMILICSVCPSTILAVFDPFLVFAVTMRHDEDGQEERDTGRPWAGMRTIPRKVLTASRSLLVPSRFPLEMLGVGQELV